MKEVIGILIATGIILWLLTGCVTAKPTLNPNYVAYIEAKKVQTKVFEIVAQPGNSIQMSGIERFTVYGSSLDVLPSP